MRGLTLFRLGFGEQLVGCIVSVAQVRDAGLQREQATDGVVGLGGIGSGVAPIAEEVAIAVVEDATHRRAVAGAIDAGNLADGHGVVERPLLVAAARIDELRAATEQIDLEGVGVVPGIGERGEVVVGVVGESSYLVFRIGGRDEAVHGVVAVAREAAIGTLFGEDVAGGIIGPSGGVAEGIGGGDAAVAVVEGGEGFAAQGVDGFYQVPGEVVGEMGGGGFGGSSSCGHRGALPFEVVGVGGAFAAGEGDLGGMGFDVAAAAVGKSDTICVVMNDRPIFSIA